MSAAAAVAAAVILVGGSERRYLLARPPENAAKPRPIVLVLHGHMGSAEQAFGLNGRASPLGVWKDIAGREGVLVAALDGERGSDKQQGWNDCRSDAGGDPKTDDVAFASAVASKLIKEEGGDSSRVYAMGMSNGAMMTFRLALEMKPPLAAFAAASGSMAKASVCPPPARPVSALLIAGTKDPLVPYEGGGVGFGFWDKDRGTVVSIAESAAIWRSADGLRGEPKTTEVPAEGKTKAAKLVWGEDPKKPQVELIKIDGGGHIEPSKTQRYGRLYQRLVGKQNHDVEAAEEAWAFFKDKRTH